MQWGRIFFLFLWKNRHWFSYFWYICTICDKFVQRDLAIAIGVHFIEDSGHMIFSLLTATCAIAHEFMNGIRHPKHFFHTDSSVIVQVVKSESPRQLVLCGAFAYNRQKLHKIPKSDASSIFPAGKNKVYFRVKRKAGFVRGVFSKEYSQRIFPKRFWWKEKLVLYCKINWVLWMQYIASLKPYIAMAVGTLRLGVVIWRLKIRFTIWTQSFTMELSGALTGARARAPPKNSPTVNVWVQPCGKCYLDEPAGNCFHFFGPPNEKS